MSLPRDYLGYLAPELVKRVEKSGKIVFQNKAAVEENIRGVFQEDMDRDDQLNQEVRAYLEKYTEQIRKDSLSYQEMYKLVKKELMRKYKMSSSGRRDEDGGRLSRDKMIELSHLMVHALAALQPAVEFRDEPNEVRLVLMQEMQKLVRVEHQIDLAVRKKITSQKREITEQSEEWDILFRKYYTDELKKLGVDMSSPG